MQGRPFVAVAGLGLFVAIAALVAGVLLAPDAGSADDLAAATCFDDPGADRIVEVDVIDCAVPHDYEVIGSVALDGETFLGDAAAVEQARITCEAVFRAYTGFARDGTDWLINALTPTSEGWAAGNRTATCIAFQFDDQLEFQKVTGSLRRGALLSSLPIAVLQRPLAHHFSDVDPTHVAAVTRAESPDGARVSPSRVRPPSACAARAPAAMVT